MKYNYKEIKKLICPICKCEKITDSMKGAPYRLCLECGYVFVVSEEELE